MLTRATATEFGRVANSGRTKPVMLVCADSTEADIEVYAKLSVRCEQGVTHLAREAIAACLAADLGLPIPRPYLVEMSPAWIASIPDAEMRATMADSCPIAFGSRGAGSQFGTWHAGIMVRPGMVAVALGIFVFDAIIQNDDRRLGNPNCLVRGEQVRIIDHELAFTHRLLIEWQPPWQLGALRRLAEPGAHIFREPLRRRDRDFTSIRAAWAGLPDSRIERYATALPIEWAAAEPDVAAAISLIKGARDHIDACLTEIERVLT